MKINKMKINKSVLNSTEWKIYDLFKENAKLGIQLMLSQNELSDLFNITTRYVRLCTTNIVNKTDLALIGDDKGYRIAMNQEEHEIYQNLLFARLTASIDKYLSATNGNNSRIHNYLNNHKDTQTRAVSGQIRMQLTNNTNVVVRKYLKDYQS